MQKFNFINCIRLIHECIKAGILQISDMDENSIYVYREKGEILPEGWYVENIHCVAQDLMEDEEGQTALLNALSEKGVAFEPVNFNF